MLLTGSTAGQYLLVHGPAWALPLAVLQRECLVSAGIWCCATFLIHAIRAAREPGDAPLPARAAPAGTVAGIVRISRIRRTPPGAHDRWYLPKYRGQME